jgi:hypothetical protein
VAAQTVSTMANYNRFFTLYNKARNAGVLPYPTHHDLVGDATKGRTESLKDLTEDELRDIECGIQELLDPVGDKANRMRRKVIGILAARGAVTGDGKPHMGHVYAWVKKYGYLHKDFNTYTVQELPKLVTQAEAIMTSDIKAIQQNHG